MRSLDSAAVSLKPRKCCHLSPVSCLLQLHTASLLSFQVIGEIFLNSFDQGFLFFAEIAENKERLGTMSSFPLTYHLHWLMAEKKIPWLVAEILSLHQSWWHNLSLHAWKFGSVRIYLPYQNVVLDRNLPPLDKFKIQS